MTCVSTRSFEHCSSKQGQETDDETQQTIYYQAADSDPQHESTSTTISPAQELQSMKPHPHQRSADSRLLSRETSHKSKQRRNSPREFCNPNHDYLYEKEPRCVLIYTVPVDWVAEHADSGSVCFNFLNPLGMRQLPPSNPIKKESLLVLAPSSYGILLVSQEYLVECG